MGNEREGAGSSSNKREGTRVGACGETVRVLWIGTTD